MSKNIEKLKIVHEINGKNYVLIHYFLYSREGINKMQERAKKYRCILQGITWEYNLFRQYRIANLLVPEENIVEFNDEILSE